MLQRKQFPSTDSQREIFTSAQNDVSASLAYNEAISLRIEGKPSIEALQNSLLHLVRRHESLRSIFDEDGRTFFFLDESAIKIQILDLQNQDKDSKEAQFQSVLHDCVNIPFDLEKGPLFRAQIICFGPSELRLVLTAHHIVCDGWSYGVLLNELGALYSAAAQGSTLTLNPAPSFGLYAQNCLQRSDTKERQDVERYWIDQFKGGVSPLNLPTDRPYPSLKTYSSLRKDFEFEADLIRSVRKMASGFGCTLMHALMASLNVLLFRLSQQEDIVVGVPGAGQLSSGLKGLVGHCIHTLPILSRPIGQMEFKTFLETVKRTMLDAYDHQEFTYGTLLQKLKIARDPSRSTLISILFNLEQRTDGNKLGFKDLEVKFASVPRDFENFELFINAVEHLGKVTFEIQYNPNLFDTETVENWMDIYRTLLESVVKDPAQKLSDLQILPYSDQEKILLQWNDTVGDYPRELRLHELIHSQVEKSPESVAVQFEDSSLSYRELDQHSNRIARQLKNLGVKNGTLVGIATERNLEMMVALLGIMKAGGTYVPLDPSYPAERLEYIVSHAQISFLVTQTALIDHLPSFQGKKLCVELTSPEKSFESVSGSPDDPLYVIYTSGSTGKPKGVVVTHRSVVNFLNSVRKRPGMSQDDILVAVTTLSFDIAVLELYLPLVVGARVVIAPRDTVMDGEGLKALMEACKATALQGTPATWRILLASGWKGSTDSKAPFRALVGGESVPRDLVNELLPHVNTVWNMYGPTETTVWSTCHPIVSSEGPVLVGRPIDNTQVYILDRDFQPVPIGVAGELFIAGLGVAQGYLKNPELTAERFIDNPYFNPFATDLSPKLYRTGDLARFRRDGTIEHLGRNDFQVKIRGFRIELSEIETVLSQHPSVLENVAWVKELGANDSRLISYVILKPGKLLEYGEMSQFLKSSLPIYMIPQHLVLLESFPQTLNGKIDRKALPVPNLNTSSIPNQQSPSRALTRSETFIAELWKELLKIDTVQPKDNFYDLGGHSLLSVQFLTKLEKKVNKRLNPRILLLNTLEQIALGLDGMEEQQKPQEVDLKPTAGFFAKVKSSVFGSKATEIEIPSLPQKTGLQTAHASPMQRRIWEYQKAYPKSSLYNLPTAFRLLNRFDFQTFEKSFNAFVNRHQILRAVLVEQFDGLYQVIRSNVKVPVQKIDLRESEYVENEGKLAELLNQEAVKPYDLSQGPLIRIQVYQLGEEDHVIFINPHHIIWDGWSFDLFLSDMAKIYAALKQGNSAQLPEPQFQFLDYSEWHFKQVTGKAFEKEGIFWKRAFSDSFPTLNLPVDKPRSRTLQLDGERHDIAYSKEVMDALSKLARSEGVTLNALLLAAFKAFLYRVTEQKAISVGVSVQGRNVPGSREGVGNFVNTLVIRTRLAVSKGFREIVRQVNDSLNLAYEHQNIPFEVLLEELKIQQESGTAPLFQASFSFQDGMQRKTQFADLQIGKQIHLFSKGTPTDFALWLRSSTEGLVGSFQYRTDLFESQTVARLAKEFEVFLLEIIEDPNKSLSLEARKQVEVPVTPSVPQIPRAFNRALNPFFFKSEGKRLFGFYHSVQDSPKGILRDSAVLLCYPIGQEYLRAHWAFRQLAGQLVRNGFPTMRFDYFGTGDSEGETAAGTLKQWMSDVCAAAHELRRVSGRRNISIVGLRFGATLAHLAVQNKLLVKNLILWDPIIRGKTYLKELAELHVELMSRDPFRIDMSLDEVAASQQFMGFPYPHSLKTEIEAIDLVGAGSVQAESAWIVASGKDDEVFRLRNSQMHPDTGLIQPEESGEWGNFDNAHRSLLAPQSIQQIIKVMIDNETGLSRVYSAVKNMEMIQ